MKANELRIGNWILDNEDGSCFQVSVQNLYFINKYDDYNNPIPLTPEILEMCGFKKRWNGEYDELNKYGVLSLELPCQQTIAKVHLFYYFKNEIFDFNHLEISSRIDDFMYQEGICIKGDHTLFTPKLTIKYLHQLQNLYFALTGQELKVNLHVKYAG